MEKLYTLTKVCENSKKYCQEHPKSIGNHIEYSKRNLSQNKKEKYI